MVNTAVISEIENKILARMVKAYSSGAVGTAEWQAQKYIEIKTIRALNRKDITFSLEKLLDDLKAELEKTMFSASQKVDADLKELNKLVARSEVSPAMVAIWEKWYLESKTAFEKMGMTLLNSADEIYINTIDRTMKEVIAGSITGHDAVKQTVKEWGENGLTGLVDKAGRKWAPEAYTNMVIQTNITNTANEAQEERLFENGIDLVEVSSHLGARPKCEPYQGKVYSLRGETKGYTLLSETSKGQADGLFGVNCKHTFYAYIPGIEKTYKPYPKKENKETYKESQKQRLLERNIRKAKRELLLAEKSGNKDAIITAQKKVSARQKTMREFVKSTGRTRRPDREQIY